MAETSVKLKSGLMRRIRSVELSSDRVRLWPLLSATDSLNREWGLPAVEYSATPAARGGADVHAKAKMMGMNLNWEEKPYEWVEPALWRVERVYSSGPMKRGIYELQLEEIPAGTRVTFACEYVPPSMATHMLLKFAIDRWLDRAVAVAKSADEYLNKRAPAPYLRRFKKAQINQLALETACRQMREMGADGQMLAKMSDDIQNLPDEDVVRVRPFEVADRWQLGRIDTLIFFMRGVRAGLLDLRWQVICPHCRGSKTSMPSLSELRKTAHCDFCNIDFETEFDRSVEARFTVNASIRHTEDLIYCVGDPSRTPHIHAQMRIEPNTPRRIALELQPGLYRLRATQLKPMLSLTVGAPQPEKSGTREVFRVGLNDQGFDSDELQMPAGRCELEFHSTAGASIDVKVEHAAWSDNAASGVLVTSLPEFHDLAAKDALVPDEELAVRSLTLLFSDLRGSTALYRQIGDAAAYALVREHFKIMQDVIRKNHGGIVKTIGDAVMAVFFSAPEALECCFEIQKAFVELWHHKPQMASMVVKLGFHRGPCIAVNFNNRIDYFGTTVNVAARIQNESRGGDIVFFEELSHDPAIQAVLSKYTHHSETITAALKGIAGETKLLRLVPEWEGMTLPQGTLMIAKPHVK
jgi:class 3 adenylate cyclase